MFYVCTIKYPSFALQFKKFQANSNSFQKTECKENYKGKYTPILKYNNKSVQFNYFKVF